MKIFYAVQATGNGHISRAAEIIPYLEKYGEVDVFLSGNNSDLKTKFDVKYRSKGLSLVYNKHGGLDYYGLINNFNFRRIYKEAKALPIDKYDIVLNDFECIASIACRIKKKPSLQFGHQASFHSPYAPRPEHRNKIGEFILKHYSKSTAYLGLHFWPYDKDILSPVLRKSILNSTPENNDFIAVYLPQYSTNEIINLLQRLTEFRFVVHTKDVELTETKKNVTLLPIDYLLFAESLVRCGGLITGAGFETPAEALFLEKPLMVIPIKGQYEQLCNAVALAEWSVPVLKTVHQLTSETLKCWLLKTMNQKFRLLHSTAEIVDKAIQIAISLEK